MLVSAGYSPSIPPAAEVRALEQVLEWRDAGGTCIGRAYQDTSLPVGWHYAVQSDVLGRQVRGWRRDHESALAEIRFWIAFWSGDADIQPAG